MTKKKNELFIYLARLDKKGIKVLANFDYPNKVHPTRVQDLGELCPNRTIPKDIFREVHENRMRYELYAESAASFSELKMSLTNRGYTHLPNQQFAGRSEPMKINEKSLTTSESVMTRRGSRK